MAPTVRRGRGADDGPDPIGGSDAVYRAAYGQLSAAVDARAAALLR